MKQLYDDVSCPFTAEFMCHMVICVMNVCLDFTIVVSCCVTLLCKMREIGEMPLVFSMITIDTQRNSCYDVQLS